MEDIALTEQQTEARNLVIEWFNNPSKKSVFVLSGYAGTGKTFLINNLITELGLKNSQVAFLTPTGKAASVLIQRGQEAMTIHRLIYNAVDEETENKLNGETVKSHQIKFYKKDSIPNYKLLIIDEISMVDEIILEDILSFGIPILAVGDIAQLPGIIKSNNLLENPDYILTDIVRQSEGDPIIQVATMAREGRFIPYGKYGDNVLVLPLATQTKENLKSIYLKVDQILCGTNKTRKKINDLVREYRGIDIKKNIYPLPGEKVIWTVNNWQKYLDDDMTYNLVNGTIGTVIEDDLLDDDLYLREMSFKPDFLDEYSDEKITYDSSIFSEGEHVYDMHQRVFVLANGKRVLKNMLRKKRVGEDHDEYMKMVREFLKYNRQSISDEQINRAEFAYAISVHKAQGSEFNTVAVIDEGNVFQESNKWLYTAITRAKKKLIILR